RLTHAWKWNASRYYQTDGFAKPQTRKVTIVLY
ncbi:MAG: hypothetical protein ACJATO_001069, partial [Arenicella sp.]